MTSRKLALGIGLGCVLVVMSVTPTFGEDAPLADSAPAMTVSGDCPSRDAIWADVKAMVPASDLGRVTAARVEVSDLGSTYHVRIVGDDGERQRTFRDVDRDCDHRARFSAIFIVVTLLPPDVLLEAPPEPPSTPPVQSLPTLPVAVVTTSAPPRIPRSRRFRVDLAALADAAPSIGGSGQSTTFGGELRGFWGAKRLAAMAALGLEPHAGFDFGAVGVDELRVPFDLGLAFVTAWSHISLIEEVGLAGAAIRISGANTADPQSSTRVDLGGRLAVAARFGSAFSAVTPVVGIHALLFPKPYEATATPQGNIGQLPALWFGVTAGVSFAP